MAFLASRYFHPVTPSRLITRQTSYQTSYTYYRHTAARTMNSGSTPSIFQLKLDPLTGKTEWVVIDEGDEVPDSFQKSLLAKTSYLDMLNDTHRNRCFRQAIEKTVSKPCHVLDIGAGTGLLSMMAARSMGSGEVTACESYLPMVKLMRKVLHLNGFRRNVNIINKRSDEIKIGVDMESRADVLVSEILDSELLGEGLIPTLQHAYDELLVENPQSVPYCATIYGQLVESTYLWKLHDLYNNEAAAIDGIHLVPTGFETILRVKPQQHPMHCDAIEKEINLLSEPFRIFEFDFWKRPESHGEKLINLKTTRDGQVHAIVTWWNLQLDREGSIFYSTAPNWIASKDGSSVGNWCDHWKQCIWFIPQRGLPLSKDEEVSLLASHTETNISYNLGIGPTKPTTTLQGGVDAEDFHISLNPERIAIYGDTQWRLSMLKALQTALKKRVVSLSIVLDDSIFLTLLTAHISKESHIMALFPGLRDKGLSYLQAVADANGLSMDRVEVLKTRTTSLTMDDTGHKEVDLLLAEPFYYGNEGLLPWQNLRFWRERTMLDPILSKNALIMPCKGLLRFCAMSLPDLWNSRRSLDKVEGFDHSVANTTLGACGNAVEDSPCLPFFIWQCGNVKELSKVTTVMEFDFSRKIYPCNGKSKVELIEDGICHGFVLWIDWVVDSENSIVISTGPEERHWKQGVKLLSKPAVVVGSAHSDGTSSIVVEASFDPSNGELSIDHSFD